MLLHLGFRQLLLNSRPGPRVLKEKAVLCYICRQQLLYVLVFVPAAAAQEHQ